MLVPTHLTLPNLQLWDDVFNSDTHWVCPRPFEDSTVDLGNGQVMNTCACTPQRFAGPDVDPRAFCITYENVSCFCHGIIMQT